MLQSTITALEQLLEVQDLSVIEQTERLERERQEEEEKDGGKQMAITPCKRPLLPVIMIFQWVKAGPRNQRHGLPLWKKKQQHRLVLDE